MTDQEIRDQQLRREGYVQRMTDDRSARYSEAEWATLPARAFPITKTVLREEPDPEPPSTAMTFQFNPEMAFGNRKGMITCGGLSFAGIITAKRAALFADLALHPTREVSA